MLTGVAWRTVGTGLPIKRMPLATRYQIGERRLIHDSRILLRTVCGDALQQGGRHYDLHNLYGWSQVALRISSFYLLYAQSEPTLEGVRSALGTRGLILSRWEVS